LRNRLVLNGSEPATPLFSQGFTYRISYLRFVWPLGVAQYFVERIRDGLFDHDGLDAELAKIKKLISRPAWVNVQHIGVDVKETGLNSYLLGMEART
jgi:hypothetical protein